MGRFRGLTARARVRGELPAEETVYVASLDLHAPLLEDVEQAIKALNGATRDSLSLRPADGDAPSMDIAGDGERFVVIVKRGGESLMLTDPRRGEHDVEVDFPGGQVVQYSASQVVDLRTALAAATLFARRGELDPAVQWCKV